MFPPFETIDTVIGEATHPEWVLLDENGHPVIDDQGNIVPRDGYEIPEEG